MAEVRLVDLFTEEIGTARQSKGTCGAGRGEPRLEGWGGGPELAMVLFGVSPPFSCWAGVRGVGRTGRQRWGGEGSAGKSGGEECRGKLPIAALGKEG